MNTQIMPNQVSTLRIGYLPFYVDYYEGICRDFPREKSEVAQRCADRLARFGEVIWDGELIREAEQADRVGKILAEDPPDCLVVVTTIAVFGGIPWAALRSVDVPVLLWNPQLIENVDAGYTMPEIVRNTSQIGTQALANTLLREGRAFNVITGYEQSPQTDVDLSAYFRVIEAAAAIRRARLLDIGGTFPLMTDVELDDEYLSYHLGPTVVHVDRDEFTKHCIDVSQDSIELHVEALRKTHEVEEITEDELTRSVRVCEALNVLVDEYAADAGTLNCHGSHCLKNSTMRGASMNERMSSESRSVSGIFQASIRHRP